MPRKFIISGGGTGGHIFPALAIGAEILRREPGARLLYVGALGGMEMEVVPRHGHEIKGVWISGIYRQLTLRNIVRNVQFPLKLTVSLMQASEIIRKFRPDAVIGTGGFASAPVGRIAVSRGIPLFLCEQNALPGLVNRWLTPYATRVLLGNADAEKYFASARTLVTGNPIRDFQPMSREEAVIKLGLDPSRPVILSLGGSLGARTLNDAWEAHYPALTVSPVQLVWQMGKMYADGLHARLAPAENVKAQAFVEDMATAYAAADLVVSRAGGSTISELTALSKPAILVPSPNVAEDHQTKNARFLVDRGAALLVRDADAAKELAPAALALASDSQRLAGFASAAQAIEKHDAAKEIVTAIFSSI